MKLYGVIFFVVSLGVMLLTGLSITGRLPRQNHWMVELLGVVLVAMWLVPAIVARTRKSAPG